MVNKLVLKYKNGEIIKGQTANFSPNRNIFHLQTLDGENTEVDVENLKSIFYVKDFSGNENREDAYIDTIAGGGKKLEVLFHDGEKLIGYSQNYSADRAGFFLVPADKGNNNERIFVINSAVKEVTLQ